MISVTFLLNTRSTLIDCLNNEGLFVALFLSSPFLPSLSLSATPTHICTLTLSLSFTPSLSQHLAEEASKASKADNIFDYQSQQNTRIYDTLGGQKEVPTSSSSASSGQHVSISESYQHILMHSAIEVTSIPLPSEGSKVPDSLEDILTLQSPTADKVTEDTSGVVTRTGIRANNATYIHALSKKMSSKFGKKSHNSALQPSTVKGTESSHSAIDNPISERLLSLGILKKSGPRSGRVLMQIPAMKPDAIEDDDNDAASDSDEYNQNLSEEEDGDF